MKAHLVLPSLLSPESPAHTPKPFVPTEHSSKSQKSEYNQTPGQASSPGRQPPGPPWGSPFATRPAQQPLEIVEELGGQSEQQLATAILKFSGVRQPSLQEWYHAKDSSETAPQRTKSASQDSTQSFQLTPHGSPKLSKPGLPIFTPHAPRKPKRRSFAYGEGGSSARKRRDSLSDLLSCNEDLNWTWGPADVQRSGPLRANSADPPGNITDSLSMKLFN